MRIFVLVLSDLKSSNSSLPTIVGKCRACSTKCDISEIENISKSKVVTVRWEDAVSVQSISQKEILDRPPEIVETYGILFKTKDYHIVMTHNSNGDDNDYLRIPNGMVREVL